MKGYLSRAVYRTSEVHDLTGRSGIPTSFLISLPFLSAAEFSRCNWRNSSSAVCPLPGKADDPVTGIVQPLTLILLLLLPAPGYAWL